MIIYIFCNLFFYKIFSKNQYIKELNDQNVIYFYYKSKSLFINNSVLFIFLN